VIETRIPRWVIGKVATSWIRLFRLAQNKGYNSLSRTNRCINLVLKRGGGVLVRGGTSKPRRGVAVDFECLERKKHICGCAIRRRNLSQGAHPCGLGEKKRPTNTLLKQ